MNRALIAAVALFGLISLTGCGAVRLMGLTLPTGVTRTTGPPGPRCAGCIPANPSGPKGATVLAGGGALTDNANDSYVAWGSFLVSGTESTVAIPVPFGGTLTNLKVSVSTAPGTGASWTFTVDKNKSATAVSCSVAGAATSCGDSSLVAVVTGDKLDLRVTPFGTPALATITWSVTITP